MTRHWTYHGEKRRNRMVALKLDCVYQYEGCTGTADTADHVIPKRLGGSDAPGNLVPACRNCNQRKGTRAANESSVSLARDFRRAPLPKIDPRRRQPLIFGDYGLQKAQNGVGD
jgi:5-methylcytosine-specific restriction endonuclease McrA